MRIDTRTKEEVGSDLSKLRTVMRLLLNAADSIESANLMLRRAKEMASCIEDPEARRKAMAAAGELKATTGNFYPEER